MKSIASAVFLVSAAAAVAGSAWFIAGDRPVSLPGFERITLEIHRTVSEEDELSDHPGSAKDCVTKADLRAKGERLEFLITAHSCDDYGEFRYEPPLLTSFPINATEEVERHCKYSHETEQIQCSDGLNTVRSWLQISTVTDQDRNDTFVRESAVSAKSISISSRLLAGDSFFTTTAPPWENLSKGLVRPPELHSDFALSLNLEGEDCEMLSFTHPLGDELPGLRDTINLMTYHGLPAERDPYAHGELDTNSSSCTMNP